MTTTGPRKPRVFAPGDPSLTISEAPPDAAEAAGAPPAGPRDDGLGARDLKGSIRWGGLFLAAVAGLATLSAGVAFSRFVSQALERQDWAGWTATGLLAIAVFAAGVMVLRELIGLVRLSRLKSLRREIDTALRTKDLKQDRKAVGAVKALYAGRHDLKWGLQRLAEHERDVRDAGDLLRLADRELMAPLDTEARRIVLAAAKRVSMVTAMSPMAWAAMLYVVVENLRMFRALASLYGGRPGLTGSIRLARNVVGHVIATGGVAMTDDLLGQFLGQDLLRRLSRRLGEGAFNGALTARAGTVAIEVVRPLPWLDTEPIRARDLLPELIKRTATSSGK